MLNEIIPQPGEHFQSVFGGLHIPQSFIKARAHGGVDGLNNRVAAEPEQEHGQGVGGYFTTSVEFHFKP